MSMARFKTGSSKKNSMKLVMESEEVKNKFMSSLSNLKDQENFGDWTSMTTTSRNKEKLLKKSG